MAFIVNPFTGKFDATRSGDEISASWLKLDQSTPQTTIGTFTFPRIVSNEAVITSIKRYQLFTYFT